MNFEEGQLYIKEGKPYTFLNGKMVPGDSRHGPNASLRAAKLSKPSDPQLQATRQAIDQKRGDLQALYQGQKAQNDELKKDQKDLEMLAQGLFTQHYLERLSSEKKDLFHRILHTYGANFLSKLDQSQKNLQLEIEYILLKNEASRKVTFLPQTLTKVEIALIVRIVTSMSIRKSNTLEVCKTVLKEARKDLQANPRLTLVLLHGLQFAFEGLELHGAASQSLLNLSAASAASAAARGSGRSTGGEEAAAFRNGRGGGGGANAGSSGGGANAGSRGGGSNGKQSFSAIQSRVPVPNKEDSEDENEDDFEEENGSSTPTGFASGLASAASAGAGLIGSAVRGLSNLVTGNK